MRERHLTHLFESERVLGLQHLWCFSWRVGVLNGAIYLCLAMDDGTASAEDFNLDPAEARALGEALIQAAELAAKGSH